MQTFVPYPSFARSAAVLDNKRLGKQRVECLQLLHALTGKSSGWINHPACRMWRGYEMALIGYTRAICNEWTRMGFKDTVLAQVVEIEKSLNTDCTVLPPWLGRADLHASHRGNLLRKDSGWYSHFGWTDSPLLPYIWP